jgi:hypothetical protein
MNRRVSDDTATYAADCVASADTNLPRLVASCALFAALLAGMSFVDAPLPPLPVLCAGCWGPAEHLVH